MYRRDELDGQEDTEDAENSELGISQNDLIHASMRTLPRAFRPGVLRPTGTSSRHPLKKNKGESIKPSWEKSRAGRAKARKRHGGRR